MKTEIGSYEAKTNLPRLLREVKAGRSFIITNRGVAIANLGPVADFDKADAALAAEQMKSFMLASPIANVDIKALREEGRA